MEITNFPIFINFYQDISDSADNFKSTFMEPFLFSLLDEDSFLNNEIPIDEN